MFIMLLNNYCVTGYRDVNDFSMYTFIYLSTCESERARKNCSDIVFPSAGPLAEYLRLGRMRPGGSWTSGTQPRSLTSDRDPTNRATTCISQSQALQYGMQASQSTYPNHQPKHPPWKIFMYLKKESTLKLQQKHKNPMKKKMSLGWTVSFTVKMPGERLPSATVGWASSEMLASPLGPSWSPGCSTPDLAPY